LPETNDSSIEIFLTTSQDDGRPIFLSGTFNHWAVGHEAYQMEQIGQGKYYFRLHRNHHGAFNYRYHKGDWNQEELDIWGNPTEKRKIKKDAVVVQDTVPRWRLNGLCCSTQFMPQKFIIEDDFEIPQLGKRRRVWALVPHDYSHSKKRYPVLYLQDAQNLFNEHAPFGNWAIDQKLSILSEIGFGDIIIIAIEHGGRDRIKEYSPFDTEQFGFGEGALYAKFIIETLKPYVDKKFRTKPHRINTGIGGSSMGGLISVYTALNYPEVFSKWMIFSPSLWLSSEIFTEARESNSSSASFVYLFGGKNESASMEEDLTRFTEILGSKAANASQIQYKLSIDPKAKHNEAYWGAEFPKAVKWLYYDAE